jgi:uncharacterized protein YutD
MFNKSKIMKNAWILYKEDWFTGTFSKALKAAWKDAKREVVFQEKISTLNLLPDTIEFVSNYGIEYAIEEATKAIDWAESKIGHHTDTTVSQVLNACTSFGGKTQFFKAAMQQCNHAA